MLIVDRDNRILYELYRAHWNAGLNRWEAGSGAVFPLTSNLRRPNGWTSADAAGLAILPGLVRYDEAFGTEPIRHAFRVTVRATNGYVFPASHRAGSNTSALPMGARLRLKASVEHLGLPRRAAARLPGDEDLRADRRRQRQRHVHHRIVRSALGSADGRLRAGLPRPARQPVRGRATRLDAAGRRRRRRPVRRLGDDLRPRSRQLDRRERRGRRSRRRRREQRRRAHRRHAPARLRAASLRRGRVERVLHDAPGRAEPVDEPGARAVPVPAPRAARPSRTKSRFRRGPGSASIPARSTASTATRSRPSSNRTSPSSSIGR